MKSVQITLIFAVLVAAIVFSGCAKPPTEEMNNAAEQVTRAENDIDAVTYGANSLARAKAALARMQEEAASKRYDSAEAAAEEATAAALRASAEGRAGVTRARDEAAALIAEVRPLITETEQGINAAKAAGLPVDFNTVDRDFDTACGDAGQAQTSLTAGRYQESAEKSRVARSRLLGINRALSVTVTETVRKK
jgi:outer membrane murein-binding lipoprotein Lpp